MFLFIESGNLLEGLRDHYMRKTFLFNVSFPKGTLGLVYLFLELILILSLRGIFDKFENCDS